MDGRGWCAPGPVCVTDCRPRWMVKFSKAGVAFVVKFSVFDDMLMSCARARKAGYDVKTMRAR